MRKRGAGDEEGGGGCISPHSKIFGAFYQFAIIHPSIKISFFLSGLPSGSHAKQPENLGISENESHMRAGV
jgi:hypothetical protein